MDLSGLITYVGLLVAAYSVLPEYRKITIRVFVGWPTICLGLLVFLASSLMASLTILNRSEVQYCYSELCFQERWLMGVSAYALAILYLILIFFRVSGAKLTTRNIAAYCKLLEELANNRDYAILSRLVRLNLDQILKLATRKPFFKNVLEKMRPPSLSPVLIEIYGRSLIDKETNSAEKNE